MTNHQNTYEHLKYAIAHTHDDDSFLIIEEKAGRHPISYFELLSDHCIGWTNAQGDKESVGGEFALPDELMQLAKNKELYLMEMNRKHEISHAFPVNATLLRL